MPHVSGIYRYSNASIDYVVRRDAGLDSAGPLDLFLALKGLKSG